MSGAKLPFFYGFESSDATSLALIPLSIRYRLDHCAIKLHLQQWQQFTLTERDDLLRSPFACTADVKDWATQITAIVQLRCNCAPDQFIDEATPPWLQMDCWPDEVANRCTQIDMLLPPLQVWQQLAPPHRHALCKIARSRHEYVHLPEALAEMLAGDKVPRKD